MHKIRSTTLIFAVFALTVSMLILNEAKSLWALQAAAVRLFAYLVFFANIAVGFVGLWTHHRNYWIIYVISSLLAMILFGSSTPFTASWVAIKALVASSQSQ